MAAADTFSHDTLHLVINQLASIVTYTDIMMHGAIDEQGVKDLLAIRDCANTAASLLNRPLAPVD